MGAERIGTALALAVATTLGAAALGVSPARAQRTAVAPFEGRRAGIVRRLVTRALPRAADPIARRRVDRAARRAGVEGLGAAGVAELAADLEADLVLQGRTSGRANRPRIELVFRAADGTELVRGETRYARRRRWRRRFEADVEGLWDRALAAWEAHRAPPPEPEPPPEPAAEAVPEAPAEPPAEAPADGLAVFAATAGVTIRTRAVDVELADGSRRRYELQSGAYPEILVALEARPFANEAHLGRGLFVRGSFAHSLGLGSETSSGAAVDTRFARFGVHAGWLAPLGERVELGLALGVGYEGYHLGGNAVLPTAEYVWLRPGARARVRLVRETLVLEARAAYRAVLGVGALRPAFGESGDAHGVDVGLGLGGNLLAAADLGLTWGVRVDYVGYFMSFAGPADAAAATAGAEESVRVALFAGWSFR
jgi:hypothetical protein